MKIEDNKTKIWNVGFYLRLSREDDDLISKNESNSITTQREMIKNHFSKLENVNFVEEYIDDGYSGLSTDRPRYQDMLKDLESKKIDTIIVKDLSRFGRNKLEVMYQIENLFPSNNFRFISVSDNIDTFLDPDSIQTIGFEIGCILNEHYSREISNKVKDAFETRKKHGQYIATFSPFGYKKDPNDKHKLIIDTDSAPIVERIFNEYNLGKTLCQIAKNLNEDKIPSPGKYKQSFAVFKYIAKDSNSYWSEKSVRRILENDIYYGKLIQNKSSKISLKIKKRVKNDVDKLIITENAVPPIISFSTFEKAKKLLEKNRRIIPQKNELDIFSGFLKCADCGRNLTRTKSRSGSSKTNFIYYYKCGSYKKSGKTVCSPHTIRKDMLEEAVLCSLKTYISIAINFDKVLNAINNFNFQNINTKLCEKNLKQKEEEQEKNKHRLDKLYIDFQDGLMNKEDYLRRYNSFNKEIENTNQIIKKTKQLLENLKQGSPKNNNFINHFIKYKDIDKLDKTIIIELIKQIKVYENKRIEIEINCQDEYLFALQIIENNKQFQYENNNNIKQLELSSNG